LQAQFVPGIYNEIQGLDFEHDDFDEIISRSFGCPAEGLKEMFRQHNQRHKDGEQIKIPECPMERELLKLLARVLRQEGSVLPYLKSRGARCVPVERGTQCQIQRDVTTLSHTGDRSKATAMRDVFSVEIFLSDSGEPGRVTLVRKGVGR
jgi:hypothetical protein